MMTTARQAPEPWKSTAATLFNPYLSLGQMSSATRHRPARTRTLTPTRHSRAPPESLVAASKDDIVLTTHTTRAKSTLVPTPNAADDVAVYVQQMIHSQFCGRSGTPSDMRYDEAKVKQSLRTPSAKPSSTKRITSSKQQHVSECPLDTFFNTTDEQMTRIASMMPGRESSFSEMHPARREYSASHRPASEGLTLGAMCHLASNIGDKMSQSKEKVGLEAIRGFRLPSAKLTYEPYEHHPMTGLLVLGLQQPSEPIRLSDILTDDNFTIQPMIEITENKSHSSSRLTRTLVKSSSLAMNKPNEWKDWRGKISQGNLPDVRTRLRRQHSDTTISPQRPCTAASNLSKSRPQSGAVTINSGQKEEGDISPSPSVYVTSAPPSSVMKNGSKNKQRQRTHPLNVRIGETLVRSVSNQHLNNSPSARAMSVESTDTAGDLPELIIPPDSATLGSGDHLTGELVPRPTPDPQGDPNVPSTTTTTTPFTAYSSDSRAHRESSPDPPSNKRRYILVKSSSRQLYRTTPAAETLIETPNLISEQFSQLTLSQLELLEQYDPTISTKIGVPFIPVQMLARPRDAHLSTGRSIDQLHRNYPQRNGQPVFDAPTRRPSQSLIDIAQTLQLTKSKRIPIERQTTFERHEDEASIEQTLQVIPYENPNRLALSLVSPSQQQLVQHFNSTRASSKAYPIHYDDSFAHQNDSRLMHLDQLKVEERAHLLNNRLSVLNIRTQQEVDQTRPKSSSTQQRTIYPTSIVTNAVQRRTPASRNAKHQGRPIPSVFLTQDPDELNYSTSIYRQARNDVDVTRAFKGFVVQNVQKKFSSEERQHREEQQKAAIQIQRAYRGHLKRRHSIESRRPPTAEQHQQERSHRRALSAKRAQFVDQQLTEHAKILDENKQYQTVIDQTGPSLHVFRSFNRVDAQYTKATLNRAATCIQRWWRGFIIRHRWNYLKTEVAASGLAWVDFARRYREVIQCIQTMRGAEKTQFVFILNQARDFLVHEKKLTAIYDSLSFNGKIDSAELEKLFEYCDLSATPYEIEEARQAVLKYHAYSPNEPLTGAIAFDIIYFVYPPLGTGVPSSRKSTWIHPIVDGEDESAIRGTPYLEPIDINVVFKFLAKQ